MSVKYYQGRTHLPTLIMQAYPSIRAGVDIYVSAGLTAVMAVDQLVQDPGPCFVLDVHASDLFGANGLSYNVSSDGSWEAQGQPVSADAIHAAMNNCNLSNVGTPMEPTAFQFDFSYGSNAVATAKPFLPGNDPFVQADTLANHLVRAASRVLTAGGLFDAGITSDAASFEAEATQALVQEISNVMSSASVLDTVIQTLVASYGPLLSLGNPGAKSLRWRSEFPKVFVFFTLNVRIPHQIRNDQDGSLFATNDLWLKNICLGLLLQ